MRPPLLERPTDDPERHSARSLLATDLLAYLPDAFATVREAGRRVLSQRAYDVQILGGMGFMRGTRAERIYREVKVMMIGGGSEEIMKDLAARQIGF